MDPISTTSPHGMPMTLLSSLQVLLEHASAFAPLIYLLPLSRRNIFPNILRYELHDQDKEYQAFHRAIDWLEWELIKLQGPSLEQEVKEDLQNLRVKMPDPAVKKEQEEWAAAAAAAAPAEW